MVDNYIQNNFVMERKISRNFKTGVGFEPCVSKSVFYTLLQSVIKPPGTSLASSGFLCLNLRERSVDTFLNNKIFIHSYRFSISAIENVCTMYSDVGTYSRS